MRTHPYIKAALDWVGRNEDDASVQRLFADYQRAWQWGEPSTDMEWCAPWVAEILRQAHGLAEWNLTSFRAPMPEHPLGFWTGRVGSDLIPALEGREVTSPQRGDIFTLGNQHTGFVLNVHADGSYTTLEANIADSVTTRRRTRKSSTRFWRVPA